VRRARCDAAGAGATCSASAHASVTAIHQLTHLAIREPPICMLSTASTFNFEVMMK
jgi:hypothetical protein